MEWIANGVAFVLIMFILRYLQLGMKAAQSGAATAHSDATTAQNRAEQCLTLPQVQRAFSDHCGQCKEGIMREFDHGTKTMDGLATSLKTLADTQQVQLESLHRLDKNVTELSTEVKNLCKEVRRTNGRG